MADTLVAQPLGTKFILPGDALPRLREILRSGGLVVHPTDTVYGLAADPFNLAAVYGLAADPFNLAAVERLYVAKARPRDLPVSVAVAEVPDIFRFGARTPLAEAFCEKNLPGPFTVVLQAIPAAPRAVVSKEGRIALRVPDHPIPRLLAKAFGPVTSTSANVHGRPAPVTCEEARAQLGDSVELYIDGGPADLGQESTVVDLTGPRARILRAGAVPRGR